MAIKIQFRRGSTNEHSTFTGAIGEVTVNTTNKSLVVHDGSTAGGSEVIFKNLTDTPTDYGTASQVLTTQEVSFHGQVLALLTKQYHRQILIRDILGMRSQTQQILHQRVQHRLCF